MNIKNYLKRWFGRPRREQAEVTTPQAVPASEKEMLRSLLQSLEQTQEVECSCDDVYDVLDQYTEMALKGEDVQHLMPLVKHHLEMCGDCCEEYEALLRVLKASTNNEL